MSGGWLVAEDVEPSASGRNLELAVDLATHGFDSPSTLSWNQIYPFLQSVADLQKITRSVS
jgi:hypothetical protein